MSEDAKVSPGRVLLLGALLVGFGAVGFHEIPEMISEQAEGTKWVNALYCAVITLTTVGFGDICPTAEIDRVGRTFIVILSFSGIGMFCGPIMGLASSWKDQVPGGTVAVLTTTVATAVFVFSYWLEEMSESEAAYFSIITGTTIGYGDIHPQTDAGKLAVAIYAIVAINVVASMLEPAKEFLLSFCMVGPISSAVIKASETGDGETKQNDNTPITEAATEGAPQNKKTQ